MHKDRKKEHKKVIKYMRKFNKSLIKDDYIGCDRFRIDLWSERWYRFSDKSGGELLCVFKLSDRLADNSAYFICDNYNYQREIFSFLNDFLIRCSSGTPGHYPALNYVAYDIHNVVPYNNERNVSNKIAEGVIDNYCWIKL